MKWNLTKESGRPLHEDQRKWDKEKQESVLIDPQKNEVDCLVKTYGEYSYPTIMTYVLDRDCWVDYDSCRNIPYNEVEKWQYLSYIDDTLDGKPEPMWCWEFGSTLAENVIPALTHWINNGISYPRGMDHNMWKNILLKIRDSFVDTKKILDGDYDELSIEDRDAKISEAENNRIVAFNLLAKHYLDLWD